MRRSALLLLLAMLVAAVPAAGPASARDGGRGGDGGGGHGGGDGDGGHGGGGHGGDDHDDDGNDHGGNGGEGRGDGTRLGHDEARAGVERGEMVPLSQVLRMIRRSGRGEPIDVELVRRRTGRIIYEVIVLDAERRLVRLYVDAADNRILAAGGY